MTQKAGWRLLSTRNIMGAVLVAGIAAGVYLGDLWKGFGGGSFGLGIGGSSWSGTGNENGDKITRKTNPAGVESTEGTEESTEDTSSKPKMAAKALPAPDVLKVVIADRSYFIRSPEGDQASDLSEVVAMAKAAPGDQDGIRVRVYRKATSRPAVEIALNDALIASGLTEEQIVWVPTMLD